MFVYGTDPSLNNNATTISQSVGSGTTALAVSAPVFGLQPATTYYFEVVALGPGGATNGSILSFTTTAAAAAGDDHLAPDAADDQGHERRGKEAEDEE